MHITRSVCRHVPWLFHGRRVFRQLSQWKNRNVYTNELRSNSKASVIIAAGATAEGPPTARITCAPPVTGQSTERKTDKESSCTVSNAGSLGQSEESARSRPAFNRSTRSLMTLLSSCLRSWCDVRSKSRMAIFFVSKKSISIQTN